MANLTIRRLDPAVKDRLRRQAAAHGHSMQEEARRLLSVGLAEETAQVENAFEWLRAPFLGLGDVELELPKRSPAREVPDFDPRTD